MQKRFTLYRFETLSKYSTPSKVRVYSSDELNAHRTLRQQALTRVWNYRFKPTSLLNAVWFEVHDMHGKVILKTGRKFNPYINQNMQRVVTKEKNTGKNKHILNRIRSKR